MTEITQDDITQLTDYIEMAESLKRLRENKDFKKVVEEYFLDGGSVNLTKNITMVKPENEYVIIEEIKSRSYLYRFLMAIEERGVEAIEALKVINEESGE